jgi:hypothetical protein
VDGALKASGGALAGHGAAGRVVDSGDGSTEARGRVAFDASGAAWTVTAGGGTRVVAGAGEGRTERGGNFVVTTTAGTVTFDSDVTLTRGVGGTSGFSLDGRSALEVTGGVLKLSEQVFATDAVILTAPASRAVRFTAPGAPGIEMTWDGFPSFGIWMRPPGAFLCLEPWHGMASPKGWDGDFMDKPGIARLAPGERLRASYAVRVLDPA